MARYTRPRRYNNAVRRGRTFRRGNKIVRYVYRGGKRVGTEVVKTLWAGAKYGARRYVADRTYRYARKRWN